MEKSRQATLASQKRDILVHTGPSQVQEVEEIYISVHHEVQTTWLLEMSDNLVSASLHLRHFVVSIFVF